MAKLTKEQQTERVAGFLEDPKNDERDVIDVAKIIVDSFYDWWLSDTRPASPPLRPGLIFKHPSMNKILHCLWMDDQDAWIASAEDKYGWFGKRDTKFWSIITESSAGPMKPNAGGWEVGTKVTSFQRSYGYTILATAVKCVLMMETHGPTAGRPHVETNENMTKHYTKESK